MRYKTTRGRVEQFVLIYSCGWYLVPVIALGGAAEAINSAVPGWADTYGWLHFQYTISDIFDFELVTCSLEWDCILPMGKASGEFS